MPRPRLETSPWWPELLQVKDELSLRQLARRFGVSVNGLSRALKRAGVERSAGRQGEDGSRRRVDPRSIEAQAWWPQFLDRKDEFSLAQLAEQFGVAEITLQRAMKRTGTSRKSQRGARGNRQARKAAVRIASFQELVGKVPDAEIAERAGVSRYSVAQYRRRRGIASVRARISDRVMLETHEARHVARETGVEPVRSGAERQAFTVRVTLRDGQLSEEKRFVVIGANLADAAEHAQQLLQRRLQGGWAIEGLEFVGVAL